MTQNELWVKKYLLGEKTEGCNQAIVSVLSIITKTI